MFKYLTLLSLLLFGQLFSGSAKAEPPIYATCYDSSTKLSEELMTVEECHVLGIPIIQAKLNASLALGRVLIEDNITFSRSSVSMDSRDSSYIYRRNWVTCNENESGVLSNCGQSHQSLSFYNRLQCFSPFKLDRIAKVCATQCPAWASKLNLNIGKCENQIEQKRQCEGNPIDVLTGEKIQSFTDYSSDTNPFLNFTRHYSSHGADDAESFRPTVKLITGQEKRYTQSSGYKGPKVTIEKEYIVEENVYKNGHLQWKHNFDAKFVLYAAAHIQIPGKQLITFNFDGRSRFTSQYPNGESVVMTSIGYKYSDRNNVHYNFFTNGKLSSIEDDNGNKVTMNYGSENTLLSVISQNGEKLSFTYNDYKEIDSVTLPNGSIINYQYDAINNLVATIYPDNTPSDNTDNQSETYHYENTLYPYALTGITDRNGVRYATWQYNGKGVAISSAHINGNNRTNIAYDTLANTVFSTNEKGHQSTIKFNDMGLAEEITGKSCSTSGEQGKVIFGYDKYGRKISKTDESGAVEQRTYASNGKLSSITQNAGAANAATTSYTYTSSHTKPITITRPNGLTEVFTYDNNKRITQHTISDGTDIRTTTYQYNAEGLISRVDGPRDDVQDITTYQYYANNYLSSVTNALGHKIQFAEYNGFGKATKITDANGVVTNLTFDVNSRLTKMAQAGRTTSYVYDALGQIKQLTSGGTQVHYEYDAARRLTAIEDNQGNRIELTVDLAGNITQRDIKGSDKAIVFTQKYAFDKINRLEKTINATGQSWTNEYDVGSNLVKQTSPDNTEVESSFDVLKRATQTLDQADSATGFEYNKLDQLTKVTDALGRSTTYEYNKFGELTKQTSPDSGITSFTYDKAGNMLTKKDARNIIVNYSYDALNRIKQVSFPGSSENITFSYDETAAENEANRYSIGRISQVNDITGSTAYYYTAFGEVAKQISTLVNGISGNEVNTTEYSYNQQGAISSITYPSGRIINYTYNSMGQVSGLTSLYNGVTQTLASNIQYLPFGPMTSLTYGNAKTLSLTFNQNYQLTKKQVNGILDKSYGFTLNGNINQITDALDTEQSQTYQYDAVARLTDADGKYGSLKYNYDAIGNRTDKTQDGVTDNYSYTNGKLMQTTAKTMNYDARGNMLQRGSDVYTYNQNGRLSTASVAAGVFEYSYNHIGQRVIKQSADIKQHFHYDLNGMVLAESDGAGNYSTEYVYLNGQRIVLIHNTTTPQVDAAPIITSEIYYLHTNHIDAPLALTDQAGALVWQVEMTPFGKTNVVVDTLSNKSITPRFPGQYSDVESGLYYNYFRDYDPELGRYIQSDPIGLSDGVNTYAYVGGNVAR